MIRAEIIDTGDPRIKSARILINAPATKIFDYLADPRAHRLFDGSASIRGVASGPDRLSLGARFGMKMQIGIRYRITNTVIEFEEGRKIAWRHAGRWVWCYELKPISATETEVTESFDGNPSISKWWLEVRKAYPYVQISIAKTLVRLQELSEKR